MQEVGERVKKYSAVKVPENDVNKGKGNCGFE